MKKSYLSNKSMTARIISLFGLLVMTACAATSLNPQASVSSAHALNSWNRIGTATWTSDDLVTASASDSGMGFLVSQDMFGDFELTIDFNPDASVNAGVLVRCQDPTDIKATNCYEINIWDHHPRQEFRTGAIVLHSHPPFVQMETLEKWNQFRIVARGNKISVWLNNELTASMSNAEARTGYVALQCASGKIRFKNLEITPL